MERYLRYFKSSGKRMWDEHWQENWFCVSEWGRNITSVEWKQVVARKKTEFKIKIMRRNKVKWSKRRVGQNMWIEINYSIKSSDLICTDLLDKKWTLKSYAGKKISQVMEKTMVDFISVASSIYHCFFFSLSGSTSGDVRCWSYLTLWSLFKNSRDLLSVAVSFSG